MMIMLRVTWWQDLKALKEFDIDLTHTSLQVIGFKRFFLLMACKFSLVALLDDAISLFLINDETELAHHFRSSKCMPFNSERVFPLQTPRWSNCWMTH